MNYVDLLVRGGEKTKMKAFAVLCKIKHYILAFPVPIHIKAFLIHFIKSIHFLSFVNTLYIKYLSLIYDQKIFFLLQIQTFTFSRKNSK